MRKSFFTLLNESLGPRRYGLLAAINGLSGALLWGYRQWFAPKEEPRVISVVVWLLGAAATLVFFFWLKIREQDDQLTPNLYLSYPYLEDADRTLKMRINKTSRKRFKDCVVKVKSIMNKNGENVVVRDQPLKVMGDSKTGTFDYDGEQPYEFVVIGNHSPLNNPRDKGFQFKVCRANFLATDGLTHGQYVATVEASWNEGHSDLVSFEFEVEPLKLTLAKKSWTKVK